MPSALGSPPDPGTMAIHTLSQNLWLEAEAIERCRRSEVSGLRIEVFERPIIGKMIACCTPTLPFELENY